MRISRISGYDLPPSVFSMVSTHQSSSVSKTVSDTKASSRFDDKDLGDFTESDLAALCLDGDADSSRDMWIKSMEEMPKAVNPDREFLTLLVEAQEVLAYYALLPRYGSVKVLSAKQSIQHVSLPEALLLFALLNDEVPVGYSRFVLRPLAQGKYKDVVRAVLHLQPLEGKRHRWQVAFHVKRRQALIKQASKRCGTFEYELHDGRLEKISGTYKGLRFVLDPEWHQDGVHFERLSLGTFRSELIRHKRGKSALFRHASGKCLKMQVLSLSSGNVDSRTFMTKKTWRLGHYLVKLRLFYSKNILMPLALHASVVNAGH
ncbi:MAG: hypothetical protein VW378_04670 [bacterium]